MLPDESFLAATAIIDHGHPAVTEIAASVQGRTPDETVRACFAYVRDRIAHPDDTGGSAAAVTASEVLAVGEGICYAQSHLLAALLQANGIPAGLRYQVVDSGTGGDVLHGIVAAWAPYLSATGGWLLMDPRFPTGDPRNSGHEWQTRALQPPFERNLPQVHAEPAAVVVEALRTGGPPPTNL